MDRKPFRFQKTGFYQLWNTSTARLNTELQRMEDFSKNLQPPTDAAAGWLQACNHLKTWLAKEMTS